MWEWMEPERVESRKEAWVQIVAEIRVRGIDSNTPLLKRAVFIGDENEGQIIRPFNHGQNVLRPGKRRGRRRLQSSEQKKTSPVSRF